MCWRAKQLFFQLQAWAPETATIHPVSGGINDLDGYGVQALVYEILHCIIHKAMPCHPALACKNRAGNADTKVTAKTLRVGACMACVRCAFVDDLKMCGLKACRQLLLNVSAPYRQRRSVHAGAHGVVPVFTCLFR